MTDQQARVLKIVANAIVEILKEFPHGAPSGLVFAALQQHGCTIGQYQGLIGGMKIAGMIKQDGDLLFAVQAQQ